MAPQSEAECTAAVAAGHDLDRVFTLDELIASDRVLFVSTPVT
jgi:fructose-1,6-bisphosphatase II